MVQRANYVPAMPAIAAKRQSLRIMPVDEMNSSETMPTTSAPRSTHFDFKHAVFRMGGSCFQLASDGEPSMKMNFGEMEALVPVKSLAAEFELEGTPDGALLDKVVAGLRFVKVIHPGDSIPREILDGTASWSVEERHHAIARGRLTLQISTWLSGEERVISDQDSLHQLVEDPAIKAKVNTAIGEIAARLGLPPERKNEVMDRVDVFVRELAYIEALRDRFKMIKTLHDKLLDFIRLYKRDRSTQEELVRIDKLMRRPIDELDGVFDQVDAQSGEIVSLLRNMESQISFIRASRDDLHERMMLWDDTLEIWSEIPVERSTEIAAKFRDLYRFVARHFIVEKEWQLARDALEGRTHSVRAQIDRRARKAAAKVPSSR
jgi:hypothetical protein